ncbi:MAG: septal ring lytic transglycosylase RlpA family protein [Alphaproteobacteria bacterium]
MVARILTGAFLASTALCGVSTPAAAEIQEQLAELPPAGHSVKDYAQPSRSKTDSPQAMVGKASWYETRVTSRQATTKTAAHRTLPFGTRLKVTNLRNGRSVLVVVNDRGPHIASRVIDVSQAAARDLDMLDEGIARVRLEPLARN